MGRCQQSVAMTTVSTERVSCDCPRAAGWQRSPSGDTLIKPLRVGSGLSYGSNSRRHGHHTCLEIRRDPVWGHLAARLCEVDMQCRPRVPRVANQGFNHCLALSRGPWQRSDAVANVTTSPSVRPRTRHHSRGVGRWCAATLCCGRFRSDLRVLHQLVNSIGNALRWLSELLRRPVSGVAFGDVRWPSMVDQALGQRTREHHLALCHRDEGVAEPVKPELRAAGVTDIVVKVPDAYPCSRRIRPTLEELCSPGADRLIPWPATSYLP